MQDTYRSLNGQASSSIAKIIKNPYVAVVLHVLIVSYASKVAAKIPVNFHWVFTHPLFSIAVLTTALWNSSKNFAFSFATISAYIVFMHYLNRRYEAFTGFKTAIYPGCTNMTEADLLDSFSGSKESLVQAMEASLVPFNVIINDDSAPLIATYLMNNNYKLKSPCSPPGSE